MMVPAALAVGAVAAPYVAKAVNPGVAAPRINAPIVDPSGLAGGIATQGQRDIRLGDAYASRGIRGLDPQANAAAAQQQQALDMYRAQMMGGMTPQQAMYRQQAMQGGQQAAALAASAQGGGYGRAAALRMGANAQAGAMQQGAAGLAALQANDRTAGLAQFGDMGNQMRADGNAFATAQSDYANAQRLSNSQNAQFYGNIGNQNLTGAQNMLFNAATGNADRFANAETRNASNTVQANAIGAQQNAQTSGAIIGGLGGLASAYAASNPGRANLNYDIIRKNPYG